MLETAGGGGGLLLGVVGVLTVVFSIAIAVDHSRHGRGRTAGGVVLGTFLWPAIAIVLIVRAFLHALSAIPF